MTPVREEMNMEKDVSWKEYFRDDERYADVINGIGFGGRQLVTGADLQEVDPQTILGRMSGLAGRGKRVRLRDAVRKVALGVSFAIIGIENQEIVDYGMPLRCMEQDVGDYEKQAQRLRKKVRKQKGLRPGEYLYGFGKDSRLYPVVTFVLYGGKDEWDGPRSLHEMLDMDEVPVELRELVEDYHLHLVDIRRLADTDVFKTDVKQVFDFIRCSGNKQELRGLVEKDESFRHMEEDAYEVVTQYVKAEELIQVKEEYRGEDGKVDMCQALKELLQDERMEGREEGHSAAVKSIVIKMVQSGKADDEIMELTECGAQMLWEVRKSLQE